MAKVNIIYHHFPHYRRPVLRELVSSGVHEYRFWGSLEPLQGIETFQGDDLVKIHPISFHMRGNTWILKGYWPAVLDRSADVIMVHGHPNMPASWLIAIVGRLTGKKVIFWAHGWLRKESRHRAFVRKLHYGLSNFTMTYAERAKSLAAQLGFPKEKVVPIYNSLDWRAAKAHLQALEKEGFAAVRKRLGISPEVLHLSCVARLTRKCRFDLLLESMSLLKGKGRQIQLCLVGAGPEEQNLRDQAARLGVDVVFAGAIYEEEKLAEIIYASDLTVSPGKVGLSAIHSMMYGTPVVSHDLLDEQMPEVEAIVPGITGDLFKFDDAASLATTIANWADLPAERPVVRCNCVRMIEERFNPATQAEIINSTVSAAVAGVGKVPALPPIQFAAEHRS